MKSQANLAIIVMIFCPLFFSTNIIFGKMGLAAGIEPFTLAMLRWLITSLILILCFWQNFALHLAILKNNFHFLILIAFLSMWICGGVVYYALQNTSATNGILIYTTSPVIVILIEAIFIGRKTKLREILGICLAVFGIGYVVFQGRLSNLLQLEFNSGDLFFVLTAFSWALYSILLKHTELKTLPQSVQLGSIGFVGALLLSPIALYEVQQTGQFPILLDQWIIIGLIVLFSSIIAFLSFQYGIRQLGASLASIFMYLMPIYGSFFSVLLLGETIKIFQISGAIFVIFGVIIASFPSKLIQRLKQEKNA